mmetsp:Transcript_11722/g.42822  ORF Transcript_11722/g.42822 Transcript_11722/m.42822 type:complete len:584 (-) Transcript_11722:2787-4538(-)
MQTQRCSAGRQWEALRASTCSTRASQPAPSVRFGPLRRCRLAERHRPSFRGGKNQPYGDRSRPNLRVVAVQAPDGKPPTERERESVRAQLERSLRGPSQESLCKEPVFSESARQRSVDDDTACEPQLLPPRDGSESRTRRVLTSVGESEGMDLVKMLEVSDKFWQAMKRQKHEPQKKGPTVVTRHSGQQLPGSPDGTPSVSAPEFDVCVCGGTLGVVVALALQKKGQRVCLIERRLVEGRVQEWNSSRHELSVLTRMGLLSQDELESCIASEWEHARCGFKGMPKEVWIDGCLNIGVSPKRLIGLIRTKFEEGGGVILEGTTFRKADVYDDGALLHCVHKAERTPDDLDIQDVALESAGRKTVSLRAAGRSVSRSITVSTRLVVDCMGHWSPIVKQVRGGSKPDGVCMVVGGCAEGPFPSNDTSDLLYTFKDAKDDMQIFWEAFPAADGRTTYMFSYTDADQQRPSLEAFLDTYFEEVAEYQGVAFEDMKFKRVMFGVAPCYRDSPLKTEFDRIIQVGDSSASQSPLSFGGFGNLIRHMDRLVGGIDESLRQDCVDFKALRLLQPYLPALSCAWLFQRSMSLR